MKPRTWRDTLSDLSVCALLAWFAWAIDNPAYRFYVAFCGCWGLLHYGRTTPEKRMDIPPDDEEDASR